MASVKFFTSAKKMDLAPIYVRFTSGRGTDLITKTDLFVNPAQWSNKTQALKQRIRTDKDEELTSKLKNLRDQIESEVNKPNSGFTKDWLNGVIFKFHNDRSADAKDLNGYIDQYIKDAESGIRKNKDGLNIAPGTVRAWKVFRRNFNEYQGVYTEKRLKWLQEEKKTPRPKKLLDFSDINIDFYNSFVRYLTDEGFGRGTIGRHIKELKMFMKKSLLEEKLHNNREFERSAFKMIRNNPFSVYLTKEELESLYEIDLSAEPEMDIARDAFLVLCETALRISDYSKVDVNIRKEVDGTKLIYITQSKTGGSIIIPLSARLEKILDKYKGKLPQLPDQYINRRIKTIAQRCKINERVSYEIEKYGKRLEKTAEKWELVTCHTGRRTACSLMYLAGIPTLSIMQISGHKTEKVFLNYIKVTPEQNARKLAAHPYFSSLKVV